MERILIAGPTAKQKNYCIEQWLTNLNSLSHPNFDVVIFDNTPDDGENAIFLNELAKKIAVKFNFKACHSEFASKHSLMERLCISHNDCREFALRNNYKHWLHLETDIFPPSDVIEKLLTQKKQVIGGLYYRDEGKSRKLMAQKHIYAAPHYILSDNIPPDNESFYLDGTVKAFAHIGLGCVMIHRSVFEEIKFRFKKGVDQAPDVYFAQDCFKKGITIFGDTSIICEHQNQAWGTFGVDYE